MKRALFAIALLALAATTEAGKRRAVAPPPVPVVDQRYLNAAKQTAAWLTSLERVTADGLAWPSADGIEGGYGHSMDGGAAGIGTFFLRLYEVTREPQWLAKAEGAAQLIAADYRANRIYGHDWLQGSAGSAHFLLVMFEATRKPEYLDAAKIIGEYQLANAIVDGDGIYWKHHPTLENVYTGVAHGAGGLGLFLVDLHAATGDARYLDAAERAYRWISKHSLPLGSNAVTWKRLTTDSAGYNGWCGGSVGLVRFFDALHHATGKVEYLEAWRRTVEGLYAGRFVFRGPTPLNAWGWAPGDARGFGTIYCHGTSGSIAVLADAAARTGDVRYAESVSAGGRWLDSVAVQGPAGATWEHSAGGSLREHGLFTGTAAVGHASLRVYAATKDETHLARAITAAEYLLAIAEHPQPGLTRWLNRSDTSVTPRYDTGWYSGGAGMALFLIELHEALQGVPMKARLMPANP